MTYKSIVENLVRQDAEAWIEDLMKQNNIAYLFTSSGDIKIEKDSGFIFTYEAQVKIRFTISADATLIVGGTVDDISGITHSGIWNRNHKVIWMDVEQTRKDLGIERFTI